MAEEIVRAIVGRRADLVMQIAERHYQHCGRGWPVAVETRFGLVARAIPQCLDHFTAALSAADTRIFTDYIGQNRVGFAAAGHTAGLPQLLAVMREVLVAALPAEDHLPINHLIDEAMGLLPFHYPGIHPPQPPTALARHYLAALLAGDRQTVSDLVMDAVAEGMPVGGIIQLIRQVHLDIGLMAQSNQISAARRHYCTAVTQLIITQLYQQLFAAPKKGRRLVAVALGDALQEIDLRLTTDYFELAGWDSYFLSGSYAGEEISREVTVRRPHMVAISTTCAGQVEEVGRVIAAIRQEADDLEPKVIVGGYPFNFAAELWRRVGADGTAKDAHDALRLADRLVRAAGPHREGRADD